MYKIKPFSLIAIIIGIIFLLAGLFYFLGMRDYKGFGNFDVMKVISFGIALPLTGGSLLYTGIILKKIIHETSEEIQDLKLELISLRKQLEKSKK